MVGVLIVRSTCVSELCVEKWVGDPSLRRSRFYSVMYLNIIFPFLLFVGDPQLWCQLLKSPVIIVFS